MQKVVMKGLFFRIMFLTLCGPRGHSQNTCSVSLPSVTEDSGERVMLEHRLSVELT